MVQSETGNIGGKKGFNGKRKVLHDFNVFLLNYFWIIIQLCACLFLLIVESRESSVIFSKGILPVTRYSILQPALERAHGTKQALFKFFSL